MLEIGIIAPVAESELYLTLRTPAAGMATSSPITLTMEPGFRAAAGLAGSALGGSVFGGSVLGGSTFGGSALAGSGGRRRWHWPSRRLAEAWAAAARPSASQRAAARRAAAHPQFRAALRQRAACPPRLDRPQRRPPRHCRRSRATSSRCDYARRGCSRRHVRPTPSATK